MKDKLVTPAGTVQTPKKKTLTRAAFAALVDRIKANKEIFVSRLKVSTVAQIAEVEHVGISALTEALQLAEIEVGKKGETSALNGRIHALAAQIRFMANFIEKNGQPVGEIDEFTAAFPLATVGASV